MGTPGVGCGLQGAVVPGCHTTWVTQRRSMPVLHSGRGKIDLQCCPHTDGLRALLPPDAGVSQAPLIIFPPTKAARHRGHLTLL